MNTTPNTVGALGEIDRIGQAALEAIWAEEAAKHPRHKEVMAAFRKEPGSDRDAQKAPEVAAEILDTDVEGVIKYAIDHFTTGTKRAQAVTEYLSARRLLTSAGVL